jgi:hypothetical protein
MSQLSTLTNEDRPWLHIVHEKKKERSFKLGKTTIDALVKEGISVTLIFMKNLENLIPKVRVFIRIQLHQMHYFMSIINSTAKHIRKSKRRSNPLKKI